MLAQKHGLTLPPNFVIDTFGRRNLEIIKDMYNWVETVEEARRGRTKRKSTSAAYFANRA